MNGLCSKVIFLALYWKKGLLNLVAADYYPGLNAKERVGGLTPGHINIKMDYRCMHVDVQTDYRYVVLNFIQVQSTLFKLNQLE